MVLCLSTNNKECVKAGEDWLLIKFRNPSRLRLDGVTFTMLTALPRADERLDGVDGQTSCSDASVNNFAPPLFQWKPRRS